MATCDVKKTKRSRRTYVASAGGAGRVNNSDPDPYDGDIPTYSPASPRDTAAEISIRAGEEISNVDIRYRGERGRIVSGTVSKPQGVPMRFDVNVDLTSAADGGNLSSFHSFDDRGFIFYGIEDDDYDRTAPTILPNGEWAVSPSKRIKVRGADVTDVELSVQPLGSVSGQLVLEESKAKECTDKQPPLFTDTLVSALHKDDATRGWTTIKSGDRISGLKITLAEGAGSLSGQLTLAEGQTVPEKLFVYLAPAESERAAEVLRFYAAPVSADGKFSLSNLAPGRYWILAKNGAHDELTKLRLPDDTERRAKLRRDAEAAKTEIEFKPCQNVVDYRLKSE
ncbi:MAG TPA: hypothetical protein VF088_18800 [Pyrinomonadaceae bacterium]